MNNFASAHRYEIQEVHPLDCELLVRAGCRFIFLTNNFIQLTLPSDLSSTVDPEIGFLDEKRQEYTMYRTRHIFLPSGLEMLVCAVEEHLANDEAEQWNVSVTVSIPSGDDCQFATALQRMQEGWYVTYEQTRQMYDRLIGALAPSSVGSTS